MPYKQTCIYLTHSVYTKCENDYAFEKTNPQLIVALKLTNIHRCSSSPLCKNAKIQSTDKKSQFHVIL